MKRTLIGIFLACATIFPLACSQSAKDEQPTTQTKSNVNCRTAETSYATASICQNSSPETELQIARQQKTLPILSKLATPQVTVVPNERGTGDVHLPLRVAIRFVSRSHSRSSLNRSIEISILNGLQSGVLSSRTTPLDSKLLQNQVMSEFGAVEFPNTFSCPDTITFETSSRSVSLPLFDLGNFCTHNQVLSASIPAHGPDLDDVEADFLHKGEITASVWVKLVTPIVSETVLLELSNEKVLDLLLHESRSGTRASSDLARTSANLKQFANRIVSEMQLPATLRMRQEIENTLLRTFFVSLPCEASKDGWCAYLTPPPIAKTSLLLNRYYELPATLQRHVRSNQRDLMNQGPVHFQLTSEQTNLLVQPGESDHPLLSTVRQGDALDIEITDIQKTILERNEPKAARISNLVCLDPYKDCLEGRWKCVAEGTVKKQRTIHHGCEKLRNLKTNAVCLLTNPPKEKKLPNASVLTPVMCENPDQFKPLKQGETKDGFECVLARTSTVEDEIPVCDTLPSPPLPPLPTRTSKIADIKSPTGTYETVDLTERSTSDNSGRYFDDKAKRELRVEILKTEFQWQCTKESETKCDPDKLQDQWTEITTFSEPLLAADYASVPLTEDLFTQVQQSLGVKLIAAHSTKVCDLTDLLISKNAPNRLTIAIRNTPTCEFFDQEELNRSLPFKLALVHKLSQKESFPCGYRVDSWNGKRSYTCNLPDGQVLSQHTTIAEDAQRERRGIWADYFARFRISGTFRRISKVKELE
jgi:hypothetical protein